ncbi:thiamine pyrophosphate-binding protein [Marinivivus vitaminiproducens]|uniref:thiamine pyrophosphate-binding protein n=1 Tax=Marinivivus vitaminiproducens TaxID=3035935 RepID=UPI00279B2025|nr:thiamine pyrophosphate-binding protein [Geminicoccaceae bacterium SCSIO 64248]
MNELSGAEAFVRLLQLHGVRHIFGLCGDTSLPLYDALHRLDHGMSHILCRDERSAAYMADAYARVSGKVGVCEGPSGGGATYILPGVVEANESSIPVLAITTDIAVSSRGRYTLTELDQTSLFRPLTKWNAVIDRASDIPRTLRTAFSQMTSGRPGAAHIGLPFDVQKQAVDEAEIHADASLGHFPSRRTAPDPDAVEAAAQALRTARNPIFVCGSGIVIASGEADLLAVAERLGIPVATTISGQGAIAENHPLSVGVVGSNGGTPETRALIDMADLVVFVGCRAGSVTTERWQHPVPGSATIIHIDVDPAVIGANYPTEIALVGDAKLALAALGEALGPRPSDADGRRLGTQAIAQAKARKFDAFRKLAASMEAPIRPERVVADLQAALPPDAIVVCDPGTPCPYVSAYYSFDRPGRHFISNRAHGALGYAMAASVGAHYGRPGAKVVAVIGDGSFGFTAGELETICRLRVPITMVVISNAVYGWIKAGQKSGFQERYFSVDFSRTDHAAVASAFGVKSWRVEDPAALQDVLKRAAETDGPTLVDVICQPLHEARAPVSEWVA